MQNDVTAHAPSLTACTQPRPIEQATDATNDARAAERIRYVRDRARRGAEYWIWQAMKKRCLNPKNPRFIHYGGRGITVCERWLHSYGNFLADMGRRPSAGHSIDRIDNDGNYEPANCRWATAEQQSLNRQDTLLLSFNGEVIPLVQWGRQQGIRPRTIRARLYRGWSVEAALTTVPNPMDRRTRPLATGMEE